MKKKKRWALAGAIATIVTVGASSTAGAAPTKNVETWICDGVPTEITVAGRSGWIDGQHYLATDLTIVGSFDPAGPDPAQPFTEEKWFTDKPNPTGTLTCTMHVDETSPEGRFVADFRVVAVPVG